MFLKFLRFSTLFLLLFLIFPFGLFAQQSGGLKGHVSDKVTGDGLPFANIVVKGASIGTACDLDGDYILRNIPSGKQTIIVSYVGYTPIEMEIDIPEGKLLAQDFELALSTIEGEEVLVTGQAQGQLAAINQQLASDNIANIVSEKKIQELPDFNAAAALSRLPGVSTTQSSGEANKVVIRGLAPKYNSIEIEGVKLSSTGSSSIGVTSDPYVSTNGLQNDRSVDLTMVSPYMIRTIAVYKSLTPDMNANSIGGTVNMELREAPSDTHFDLLWQQGYTAKSNTFGNYRFVASGSDRFFGDKLGIYALVNAESYDRNADNLNASYLIAEEGVGIDPETGFRPMKVSSVVFNRHIETRDRFGGNLIIDYALPFGSIKFVNLYARLNSDYKDNNQTLNYNNGRMEWRLQLGENVTEQRMHSIKLDYDFDFLTADLSASFTSSNNVLDKSPVINFNQVGGILIQDRDNLVPEDLNYLVQFAGDSNVVLRSGNLFSNDYHEEKFAYKADFEIPFNIGNSVSGSFKFGGQFTRQLNSTDQEAPYLAFNGTGDVNSSDNIQPKMIREISERFGLLTNDAGDFTGELFLNDDKDLFDAFLDDKYGDIYFSADPDLLADIMDYIVGNPEFDASNSANSSGREGGWYDGPFQQLTNDYHFSEEYYAGYAMTKLNFLNFVVLGGARYEKVESDYFAYNARDMRNPQLQRMYDTTSVSTNDFILPMGQIKYSPFNWMDIRYAYTQTLARPDYHQLSPKFTITQGNYIYTGNPELKPAKAYNHDINLTFHTNELGLLTIGAFYKTIENFVFSAAYNLDAAQNAGVDSLSRYQIVRNGETVVTPQNGSKVYRPLNNPYDATVKGIELDFQHSFWYLPAPFNNLVFGINYARIYSETKYPFYAIELIPGTRPPQFALIDSSSNGRLIDQPNHILNTYIGYDYEGFSARFSVLFQDNSARYNGGEYPENNSNTKEYLRIDFSARQKLPWYDLELFMDLSNLNNEKTSWIQESTGGYQGIQNYGLTGNFGVRLRY